MSKSHDRSEKTMNFGSLGGMGGAVAGYLATPEGKKAITSVLPALLDGLNLPPAIKDAVKSAIGSST
jgi:hypothetical protein